MCQCVISDAIRNSVRNFIYDIGSVCDIRFDGLLAKIFVSIQILIQTESMCVAFVSVWNLFTSITDSVSASVCVACVLDCDYSFLTFIAVEYTLKLRLRMVFASLVNIFLSDSYFSRNTAGRLFLKKAPIGQMSSRIETPSFCLVSKTH